MPSDQISSLIALDSYEYRRRYYTCGEYESSFLQTKATASINSPSAVSSVAAGHGATCGYSAERIEHITRQSNLPMRS
jgi:hypothetical protein